MSTSTETKEYQITLSPKDTENVCKALNQLKGIIDEINSPLGISDVTEIVDLVDLEEKIFFQAEKQGGWIL